MGSIDIPPFLREKQKQKVTGKGSEPVSMDIPDFLKKKEGTVVSETIVEDLPTGTEDISIQQSGLVTEMPVKSLMGGDFLRDVEGYNKQFEERTGRKDFTLSDSPQKKYETYRKKEVEVNKLLSNIDSLDGSFNDFTKLHKDSPRIFEQVRQNISPDITQEEVDKTVNEGWDKEDAFLWNVYTKYKDKSNDQKLEYARKKRAEIPTDISEKLPEISALTGKQYNPTTFEGTKEVVDDINAYRQQLELFRQYPPDYSLEKAMEASVKYAELKTKLIKAEKIVPSLVNNISGFVFDEETKSNPNATPLDVGRKIFATLNPQQYAIYQQAGGDQPYSAGGGLSFSETPQKADAINREMMQLGINAFQLFGNKTAIGAADDANKTLNWKFTLPVEEETKHMIAAKLRDNGINPRKATQQEKDEIANTLPETNRNIWFEKNKSDNNVTLPNTGFLYSTGTSYYNTVEDATKSLLGWMMPQRGRERSLDVLQQQTSSGVLGENPESKARLNALNTKEEAEGLNDSEMKEKEQLETFTDKRTWWDKFKDLSGSGVGQFAGFGTISAFTGGLANVRTLLGAGRALISPAAGKGGMLIAGYLMSREANARDAVSVFPEENDGIKRFVYGEVGSYIDTFVERLFPEEKFLSGVIKKDVARLIPNFTEKNLRSQLNAGLAEKIGKTIFRGIAEQQKVPIQESIEEIASAGLKDVFKSTLDPEYDTNPITFKELLDVGTQAYLSTLLLGVPKGLMAQTNKTVPLNAVWDAVKDDAGYRDIKYTILSLKEKGELTDAEANKRISMLNTGRQTYQENPVLSGNMGGLSLPQKQNYLARLMNEKLLEKRIENAKGDETVIKDYNRQITESKKVREAIFSGEINVNENNDEVTEETKVELTPEEIIVQEAGKGTLAGGYSDLIKAQPEMAADVLLDYAKQKYAISDNAEELEGGGREITNTEVDKAVTQKFPTKESVIEFITQPKTQTNETTQTQTTPEAETSVLAETKTTAEPPVSSVDLEKQFFHEDAMFMATRGEERDLHSQKKNELYEQVKDNEGLTERQESFLKENIYTDATKTADENLKRYAEQTVKPVSSVEGGEVDNPNIMSASEFYDGFKKNNPEPIRQSGIKLNKYGAPISENKELYFKKVREWNRKAREAYIKHIDEKLANNETLSDRQVKDIATTLQEADRLPDAEKLLTKYGYAKNINGKWQKPDANIESKIESIESKAESTDEAELNEAIKEADEIIDVPYAPLPKADRLTYDEFKQSEIERLGNRHPANINENQVKKRYEKYLATEQSQPKGEAAKQPEGERQKPLKAQRPRIMKIGSDNDLSPRTRSFIGQLNEYPEMYAGFTEHPEGGSNIEGITNKGGAKMGKLKPGVEFRFYNSSTNTESRYYVEGNAEKIITAVEKHIENVRNFDEAKPPTNEKETTPISDTPKNQSADIGTSEKTGEATSEGKTTAQKGKELADRIRGLKSKRDVLQANIFGIPIAIYDGALEVVATAIEKGAILADAIQQGIKYIRDKGGNDLDEGAFTAHINDVSEGVKPKVKVQVGEPEGIKKDNKAVIGRLMKSENVPDEIKEIFKENDLKYKVRSQAEARKVGNAVIEAFGIDEAVLLAEAGKFHGDVNSMIFALSLDRMYDIEQTAATPETKQEAAEQYADIAMRYQDAAESGGRFISAINDFYKKSPAGLVIKAEKEFQRRQDEYFEGREKPTKEAWQEFINTVEGKELLEEEMAKVSPKKKKLFTPDTEAKIKNFFSKLKINTKGQVGSYLIPPQIYNAAIDVIENAVLAGVSIGKAIEQAVEYIGDNYKEAWKVKEFKKDIRDGFKKQGVQRVLSTEDRENILKKWNKKLIGLNQEQKNTLLNKAFLELIDNGALEYDQFKQLYAEALGLPQMTPELAAQLKELATKINEPSKIKDEILKTKSPELISKYRDAVKDAEIAATKLNDLIGKQKWWLNTFLTVMRLNTLGAVSLVGNIAYNVAALPVRFAVNLTATGIDYLLAGVQLTSDKVFGTSLYTNPPTHNVFKIQGGFLRGLWLGTTTSIKQFFTGLSNRDYFQKEIKQNIKPLTSAKKFIRGMTGKQKLTLNEKLNSFIEAFPTMGMSAEVIARALNIGDKGFRFAAEYAKAEQLGQQKGLKGIDKEIFILFPDEESENKIREAGEKIVFQQKNVVTKAMDSAGNAISSAVKKQGGEAKLLHGIAKTLGYASQPFLNTPLNVFNEFIHYAFPPLPLYRAGKAMVQGDSEKAVYHLSQAVVGLSIGYAATQLVAQGLISGSGDDDEQKERVGIQTFQRQGQINLSGLKRLLAGSYDGVEDDDTWVDLKYYGFIGMLLLSKASQYKGKTKEQIEGETYFQDVVGQFVPAVKTGLTEGVFSGTSSLMNAISMGGRYTDNWVLGMGNVFVNAFEPNWLRSLSMANNDYIRDTRDMSLSQEAKNQLKNRFFSGKDLPSKIDIWGERIESVPVGSNRYMYNIMGLNKKNIFDNDQFGYALYDYYNQTKNYNIFPPVLKREVNNQALTPEQYEQFSILVGSHRRQLINPLIQSGKFEKLKGEGVESVTKELDKKYDEARKLGVKEFENLYPEFKLKKKK